MSSPAQWTAKEDAVLQALSEEGLSVQEIAERLKRSKRGVIGRRWRLNNPDRCRLPPSPEPPRRESTWTGLTIEAWDERKARVERERYLSGEDMDLTRRWAAEFAYETPKSCRAALGVIAGKLNDPALLRHVADKLEELQRRAAQ